jgi:nitric oxide dioxygenase
VCADADAFADAFYGTLFEISPGSRALFPADMTAQRGKLVDELVFLVGAARDLDAFVERARELGRRHVDYGVSAADYDAVGAALLTAVADRVGDAWTPAHQQAWTKLYRLIADVMREGADSQLFA